MEETSDDAIQIFLSYAHEDEALLKMLKAHLSPLLRSGKIETWYDRDISAGTEWIQEIITHLNTAQIILLLISPDFINSEYCYGTELKRALERHKREEARVIPVILRPSLWQETILSGLQALPTDAKPVMDRHWHDPDEALLNVARGIRDVVDAFTTQKIAEKVDTNKVLKKSQSVREMEEWKSDGKKQKRNFEDYERRRWKNSDFGENGIMFLICYTREDEMLLHDLIIDMDIMMRPNLIKNRLCYDISIQTKWEQEISDYIRTAQIILLLINPNFINSDYCNGVEMALMLEQYRRGQTRVIPLILRHCLWKNTPLGELQPLPKGGSPIIDPSGDSHDMALIHVVKEIRELID